MPETFLRLPVPGERGLIAVEVDAHEVTDFHPRYRAAIIKEFIAAMSKSVTLGLKVLLPKIPEWRGTARASVKPSFGVTEYEVTGGFGSELEYMTNLEFGREPGTWPNIGNLTPWVEDKALGGVKFGKTTTRGITYAIANRIRTRGIEGHHMFDETATEIRPKVEDYFERAVEKALAQS